MKHQEGHCPVMAMHPLEVYIRMIILFLLLLNCLFLQNFLALVDDNSLVGLIHTLTCQIVDSLLFGRSRGFHLTDSVWCYEVELHLVDIDISTCNGETNDLLTLIEFLENLALHCRVGVPVVAGCLRNTDSGKSGQFTILHQTHAEA